MHTIHVCCIFYILYRIQDIYIIYLKKKELFYDRLFVTPTWYIVFDFLNYHLYRVKYVHFNFCFAIIYIYIYLFTDFISYFIFYHITIF